jgi:cytochrome c peroxidase
LIEKSARPTVSGVPVTRQGVSVKRTLRAIGLATVVVLSITGHTQHAAMAVDSQVAYNRKSWQAKYVRPVSIPFPPENEFTPAREQLGRTLFFDPRLSSSQFISCATCHNPGFAWTDPLPKAIGNRMKQLPRRTPTLLNIAWADVLFWDGRADSLEQQALGPIAGPEEMNCPLEQVATVLARIPEYRPLFERAYPGESMGYKTVARALATFERTIVSERAPFDNWVYGQEFAISDSAKRGFDLFNSKAACQKCHSGWNFTDNGFHDIGLRDADRGRGVQLDLPAMQHAFKTPTLRDADRRGPYMHDGSAATLEEVIDVYDRGGLEHRPSVAPEIAALHLTAGEKADLIAFLHSLTAESRPVRMPALPR